MIAVAAQQATDADEVIVSVAVLVFAGFALWLFCRD